MPRVPVHTIGEAPEQSREALRGLERRMGRLLNIHAEMAHAPVVLAAYEGIQQAIAAPGSFDAKTREAIALAVAAVDECAYCQSAHTAGGRAAGWLLEETVAIRDDTADLGPKLGSLLAVAREIAGNTGYVADATWRAGGGLERRRIGRAVRPRGSEHVHQLRVGHDHAAGHLGDRLHLPGERGDRGELAGEQVHPRA